MQNQFKDLKNLLNERTYSKLKKAIIENKPFYMVRIVNGNKYNFKLSADRNKRIGIIVRNITGWSAMALLIDNECFNTNYNDFINNIA